MNRSNRSIAIAMTVAVSGACLAQSTALQLFQQRQLQLDRTLAMLNAHAHALVKRGDAAEPSEVDGEIKEVRPNSDGSVTAVTSHGKAVTYNPQLYRPIYVQQRDRTLFGLIPERNFSTSAFWTRAPGVSGFRTSVSYSDLPYGKLPNPDAKESTTGSLSQSTSWMEHGAAVDSYGFNLSHQFNSDLEPLQYSGSFGLTADQGATRQMVGGFTVAHTFSPTLTLSATASYFDGVDGANGWTGQADVAYTVTPCLVVYGDAVPPTPVQGVSAWDIGAQATLCPNLSFTFEFDQGQVWFMGLTGRFKSR